jgi:hypothetical protein
MQEYFDDPAARYANPDSIDFGLITMGIREFPFFKDDLFLGMQAMNVGLVDPIITKAEYSLLATYAETERTPIEQAMETTALSQMWVYGLYEVLRLWRDRRYEFQKLLDNSGIDSKLNSMKNVGQENMVVDVRKEQLRRFRDELHFRKEINDAWDCIEPVYRIVELFRMNLAKHSAPGRNGVIPRSPGYGRINMWCGAMDFELVHKEGHYSTLNRRDIADMLRACISEFLVRPHKF